jgi:hypothetical protein
MSMEAVMSAKERIVRMGHEALRTNANSPLVKQQLHDSVTLTDWDRHPPLTLTGVEAVAAHLETVVKPEIDPDTEPVIEEINGEVICLDRMHEVAKKKTEHQHSSHCCVDRFTFEDGKVKHIDICLLDLSRAAATEAAASHG